MLQKSYKHPNKKRQYQMSTILNEDKENLQSSPVLSAKQYSSSSMLGSTMFTGGTFNNCSFNFNSPIATTPTRLQPARKRIIFDDDSDED